MTKADWISCIDRHCPGAGLDRAAIDSMSTRQLAEVERLLAEARIAERAACLAVVATSTDVESGIAGLATIQRRIRDLACDLTPTPL